MRPFFLLLACLLCSVVVGQNLDAADEHAQSIAFTKNYKAAAIDLVAPFDHELEKARAIFSWIAMHIRYDYKQLERRSKQKSSRKNRKKYKSLEEFKEAERKRIAQKISRTLRKKRGVCQDYSWLFQAMCREVGLEASFVTGHSRNSKSKIGKKLSGRGFHAWNAVKVEDEWTFVDVTWSATNPDKTAIDRGYFDIDPDLFQFTHFPDSSKWMLAQNPFTIQEFANLPKVHRAFHNLMITDISIKNGILKARGNEDLMLYLEMPEIRNVEFFIKKGPKPQAMEFYYDDGKYAIPIGRYLKRGEIHISISADNRVKPILSYKVT